MIDTETKAAPPTATSAWAPNPARLRRHCRSIPMVAPGAGAMKMREIVKRVAQPREVARAGRLIKVDRDCLHGDSQVRFIIKSGPLPRILAGDRIDQVKAARVLGARLVIALHRVVEGPLRVEKFHQTRLAGPV